MQKLLNRVGRRPMGHIFTGVTRAGAASRRPYGMKLDRGGKGQESHLTFQISAAIAFSLPSSARPIILP